MNSSLEQSTPACPLSVPSRLLKRFFDLLLSIAILLATSWIIGIAYLLSSWDTGQSGFFRQTRIGRHGDTFKIIKIRTMKKVEGVTTTVTTDHDPRITPLGRFFRKTKIDELPQLINVVKGDMSFVGPRPDVPGFADLLTGEDRLILTVRPGITGPASLRFRDEQTELASRPDPERYNREVIFPEKVRLNLQYVRQYSFARDLKYIYRTVVP